MTRFDIEKVLESKRELRKELRALPVAEKLRMLDELRRRARTLKAAVVLHRSGSDDAT